MRQFFRFIVAFSLLFCIMAAAKCQPDSLPIIQRDGALEGYTLLSVMSYDDGPSSTTGPTLIDMSGNIIHYWPICPHPSKMLPGGDVIGGVGVSKDNSGSSDLITTVQFNWNHEMVWSFANWDNYKTDYMMSRQHHDFEREGNPVGYYAPGQDFVDRGKTLILAHKNILNPSMSDKEILDDVLYEINWDGSYTGFEWHASDHFEEFGFDSDAKAGIYQCPPPILYQVDRRFCDWLHLNTLSVVGQNHWYEDNGDERFNPENIIISSRNASFIAIVSKKTGKIVWRVGPDFSAASPESGLGQFQGQHHVHMIPKNLPGAGNILLFDNGGPAGYGGVAGFPKYLSRNYSRVLEFNPVTLEIVWQYGSEFGSDRFYSAFVSSAQRLPNGNTLITAGNYDEDQRGRVFEVTQAKEIVWNYLTPSNNEAIIKDFLYRAYRIPPEWLPQGINPAGYPDWGTLFPVE
jgi:hypothetical protein